MGAGQRGDVVAANVAVHTRLASTYRETEPHFRPENVRKVTARVARCFDGTRRGGALLDLGCGTGFVIEIAKPFASRIVGVDVTRAMLDEVDTSGHADVALIEGDTASVDVDEGSFDVVTAYSFLHHLEELGPTLDTAYRALRDGGRFYADLDPNRAFWDALAVVGPDDDVDAVVRREVDAVHHRAEQIESETGISSATFELAEYGKDVLGGFREDDVVGALRSAGFAHVEFWYEWFLGQAAMVNDPSAERAQAIANADLVDAALQRMLPLSRHLFKYVGFVATK